MSVRRIGEVDRWEGDVMYMMSSNGLTDPQNQFSASTEGWAAPSASEVALAESVVSTRVVAVALAADALVVVAVGLAAVAAAELAAHQTQTK